MQEKDFRKIKTAFSRFHRYFSPDFHRKQWRERGGDYLRGLLVQTSDRRNAENLAEATEVSPRSLQRFLTESKWDDSKVIESLQRYLRPRLSHTDAVWIIDDTGFLKRGKKSAGVSKQYCGRVASVVNCQTGVFLGYASPRGRALVDKRLYLPHEWIDDPGRCEAAGIPQEARKYHTKIELALSMLLNAKKLGYLRAGWVTADDLYGRSEQFRDGVAALGLKYVVDVPKDTRVWPINTRYEMSPPAKRKDAKPRGLRPVKSECKKMEERAEALPERAWQEITIAEGSQGPRMYLFAVERLRVGRNSAPGEMVWAVYRKNLDGSEPRYYLSNAGEEVSLFTLACVGGTRWSVETEFQFNKGCVGMDQYEVRSYPGWNHHITMCLLANVFLLTLQQEWGEKYAPIDSLASISCGAGTAAEEALQSRVAA